MKSLRFKVIASVRPKLVPAQPMLEMDAKMSLVLSKLLRMREGSPVTISNEGLLRQAYSSIFSSMLVSDIDGTILRPQSQVKEENLVTLSAPEYHDRLRLIFLFANCGFPLHFISAGSLKSQTKKIIKPLVDLASTKKELPVLNGIGLFANGATQHFEIKEGNLIENLGYQELTRFQEGLKRPLLDGLESFFQNQALLEDRATWSESYPGFALNPLHIDMPNPCQIIIHPLPSWRYNMALYHKNPENRMDKRSQVISALRQYLQDRGLLDHVNITEGGKTSIDITLAKVNKAYAMRYLLDRVPVSTHITYLGDEVYLGGNDMPIAQLIQQISSNHPTFSRLSVMALNADPTTVPTNIQGVYPIGTNDYFSMGVFMNFLMVLKNGLMYNSLTKPIGPIVAKSFEQITWDTLSPPVTAEFTRPWWVTS